MFSTLLILLWQKNKNKKIIIEIPHPINTMTESGGCNSDNNLVIAN